MVEVYADQALSGRQPVPPGVPAAAGRCRARRFDVIVVEALDRLSRKLADVADLHDRLSSCASGCTRSPRARSPPCMSACSAPWRRCTSKDLAEKTRRGQLGRALKGRIPGGKAYGYDVLPAGADGAGRAPDQRRRGGGGPAHLRAVRRRRQPARDRQAAERRAGPGTGRPGLAGHHDPRPARPRHRHPQQRALCRPAGWNRCAYVKDPRTGKRVARPNPREQWEIVPVPELRIVTTSSGTRSRRGRPRCGSS